MTTHDAKLPNPEDVPVWAYRAPTPQEIEGYLAKGRRLRAETIRNLVSAAWRAVTSLGHDAGSHDTHHATRGLPA